MIRLHTEKGEISISDAALSNITGAAATSCFGVKGMAFRSMTDGLVHLLRREAMSKGVRIIPHEEGEHRRRVPLHYQSGSLYGQRKHRREHPQCRRLR